MTLLSVAAARDKTAEVKRMRRTLFKPKFDKLYWFITVPTAALTVAVTVLPLALEPVSGWAFAVMLLMDAFVAYFLLSPLAGYVELREKTLFIRYGFILKKEIPYDDIRDVTVGRGIISESMVSLKNAMEHVTVKYGAFEVTVVSVDDNLELAENINVRRLFG